MKDADIWDPLIESLDASGFFESLEEEVEAGEDLEAKEDLEPVEELPRIELGAWSRKRRVS